MCTRSISVLRIHVCSRFNVASSDVYDAGTSTTPTPRIKPADHRWVTSANSRPVNLADSRWVTSADHAWVKPADYRWVKSADQRWVTSADSWWVKLPRLLTLSEGRYGLVALLTLRGQSLWRRPCH
ncbi:hypothetical protein FJY63_00975 [Candidatus Sumerlaeota bacterium]|nr:hypothetical protein [Candidatus Sumerlaeota bacterium]